METTSIYQNLGRSFERNLFVDSWDKKIFKDLLARFHIKDGEKIGKMSSDRQIALMMACSLAHDSQLLLFDKPAQGLPPAIRSELLTILQEYAPDKEKSVLIASQTPAGLEQFMDCITVVSRGRQLYSGDITGFTGCYLTVKGPLDVLTPELQEMLLDFQKSGGEFEGLILKGQASQWKNCLLTPATLDQIISCM